VEVCDSLNRGAKPPASWWNRWRPVAWAVLGSTALAVDAVVAWITQAMAL
jgi:hypothetical protein